MLPPSPAKPPAHGRGIYAKLSSNLPHPISARPEFGNVIGAVHGGVIVTLLDVVMASAAVSSRDFQRTAVTLNLDSSFIGPGRGAHLLAELSHAIRRSA